MINDKKKVKPYTLSFFKLFSIHSCTVIIIHKLIDISNQILSFR